MTTSRVAAAPPTHLRRAAVLALAIGLLVPFANKPFHIDDPLFLWAADAIRQQPAHPYSSAVNWYGMDQPMWFVMQNPPLHAYFLALVQRVGAGEVAIHLAMLLPVVVCVLAVWELARSFGSEPSLAVAWCVLSPAFLLSASTVMCDIPMLAWWTASCACWVRGMDRGRPGWLAAAALFAGIAGWTKYFGMACPLLLLVYALVQRRRIGVWAAWLAVPLAMYLIWHYWSRQLFGVSHIVQAMRYPALFRGHASGANHPLALLFPALSFAGGGLMTPLLFGWFVSRRWRWVWGTLAVLVLAVAFGPALSSAAWKAEPGAWQWAQYLLLAAGGAGALALGAVHLSERRDAAAVCLACWIAGTFCFAVLFNWTVSGRTVLPMVPAVAILLAREIKLPDRSPWVLPRVAFPTGCVALVSLAIVWVDTRWAAIHRQAANEFAEKYQDRGQLWFSGHWGLQYYLERHGARSVQRSRPSVGPGDWLLVPRNNPGADRPVPGTATLVERRDYPHPRVLAVMKHDVGAGFYSSVWGPLPFAFGSAQPETFELFAPVGLPESPSASRDSGNDPTP